ncbi:hypothetical protein ACE6H2_016189 [Prunus campanulata]
MHSMPLSLGTFWVQLHGVHAFYMIVLVAKAIEDILGEVLWVDKWIIMMLSSAFLDREGGTNLRGNSIGSSARHIPAPSPPFKSPIHSPQQAGFWTNNGSGNRSSSGTQSWGSSSPE